MTIRRRTLTAWAAAFFLLGGAGAGVPFALSAGGSVSCGTTATTVAGRTVDGHGVSADGSVVTTWAGVTDPGTAVELSVCATAPDASTVTVTAPPSSTAPTTTTVPTTTTSSSGTLFWSNTFESGALGMESHTGMPTWGNSSATVVGQGSAVAGLNNDGPWAAPAARTGTKAVGLLVDGPSNKTGSAGGQRAELTSSYFDKVNTERWFGLSVYIPSAPSKSGIVNNAVNNNAIWQTGWGTSLSLKLNDQNTGNFEIADSAATSAQKNGWSGAYYTIGPILYDQWVDFTIHVFWSTGSSGYFEVYENGVLQTLKGLSVKTFSGTRVNGPNYGVASQMDSEYDWYRVANSVPSLLYLDDLKIGDTYAVVQP
jgi:hypothetical protein